MAKQEVIIPLNQSFVTPLGEPTGWDGPYTTYNAIQAKQAGGAGVNALSHDGYYPFVQKYSTTGSSYGYYFDIDNPGDAQPWKDYDGSPKDTGTVFEDVPPTATTTNQPADTVLARDDGTMFAIWGTQSGVAGKGCTWDIANNAVSNARNTADTDVIRYWVNTGLTDSSGENYAIAESGGTIYGFGGCSNNTGNAIARVGYFDESLRDWRQIPNDLTTVAAAFGSEKRTVHFAITLPSGVIWVGGGTNQVSAVTTDANARFNTFYYDPSQPEGSRITAGPTLPHESTNVWFSNTRPVLLGNGEVYFLRNTGTGDPAGGVNRGTIIVNPETGDYRKPYDYYGDAALVPVTSTLGTGSLYYGTTLQILPDGRFIFVENNLATYISRHD